MIREMFENTVLPKRCNWYNFIEGESTFTAKTVKVEDDKQNK